MLDVHCELPACGTCSLFLEPGKNEALLCVSLYGFPELVKQGGCDFPALICFNPWWCGALLRFWDLETV
jgi:hypothetical protein